MEKIKIFLIVHTLKAGGAERIFSFLANHLSASRFAPTLIVIGYPEDAVYQYPENTIFLRKDRTRNAIADLIKLIRSQSPKLVIGSVGQINIMLGLLSPFFRKTKFVGRTNSVISVNSKYTKSNHLSQTLYTYSHKKLHGIICQSKDMAIDLQNNFGIPETMIRVINNPITKIPEREKKPTHNLESDEKIRFVTIGRLDKVKGHSRILTCLSKANLEKYHYTIVGSGPLEEKIKTLVEDLGLEGKVHFIPYTNDVYSVLETHDIFLQGSYVEGFPNAVLESCTIGVPVLAFEAPGGTGEIISNGVNGFLVKSEEEYIRFLNAPTPILELVPHKISQYTIGKFSSDQILGHYEDFLLELIQ